MPNVGGHSPNKPQYNVTSSAGCSVLTGFPSGAGCTSYPFSMTPGTTSCSSGCAGATAWTGNCTSLLSASQSAPAPARRTARSAGSSLSSTGAASYVVKTVSPASSRLPACAAAHRRQVGPDPPDVRQVLQRQRVVRGGKQAGVRAAAAGPPAPPPAPVPCPPGGRSCLPAPRPSPRARRWRRPAAPPAGTPPTSCPAAQNRPATRSAAAATPSSTSGYAGKITWYQLAQRYIQSKTR